MAYSSLRLPAERRNWVYLLGGSNRHRTRVGSAQCLRSFISQPATNRLHITTGLKTCRTTMSIFVKRGYCAETSPHQVPITPPSSFVMTTVAERGRVVPPSAQRLTERTCAKSSGVAVPPGCCTLMNIVRPSGVVTTSAPSRATPVRQASRRRAACAERRPAAPCRVESSTNPPSYGSLIRPAPIVSRCGASRSVFERRSVVIATTRGFPGRRLASLISTKLLAARSMNSHGAPTETQEQPTFST